MPKISFNVDAYTARLIGRENVAKLNGAILELVKNTYDADASVCFLYYDDKSKSLYIGDNGYGMTSEVIIKNWMTIGRSTKKESYVSKSGRVQTGAKGIGRFALDRIADQCTMLTASEDGTYVWVVDWRAFESESAITDVSAELDKTTLSFMDFTKNVTNRDVRVFIKNNFKNYGTVFKLSLLRDEWGKARIQELKNELNTLIPNELSQIFNIYLFDNETTIEDAVVLHDSGAFSFDYKIQFEVTESGSTDIQIWRNEFDFKGKFDYVMEKAGFTKEDRLYFKGKPILHEATLSELILKDKKKIPNTIGSFSGTFYFIKMQIPTSDKLKYYYKDIPDRRNFRDTFGGLKIYRDQFRVRPYGDPHTSNFDWLQLSSRKNRSPAAITHPDGAWRVTADQMLGSIYISRINITLPDQANREGIVETKEFGLLKEFLLNVIQLFEKDRQYVFRKLNELYKRESEAERYLKEIEEKAAIKLPDIESPDRNSGVIEKNTDATTNTMVEASKAQKVIEYKEEIIRNLEDENRMLRVLATTGITTNSYIHEFQEMTHRLNMKIVMAKEALEYDHDQSEALRHLALADQIRSSFTSWFRVTIESVRRDKRSFKTVNLNEFIQQLCDSWQQVIVSKAINILITLPETQVMYRCFPYEIEIILSNLITNSVTILSNNSECMEKNIWVRLSEKEGTVCLEYSDSGPGLSTSYKNDPELILEPFESNKTNELGELIGTGMGMWLIKRTVSNYNGSIDLSRNKTESRGFYFILKLPASK
ncbi:sensor histidine kinase [Desulfitobacterium hafniense]|uniref:sensor histidine kinase n=1 Tax=Desulfitobacterium hafniense TaxID=49338 RepID=UPI000372BF2E|nr:sensor histidine kinase [Desulfitobacterium hafniense]